MYCKHCTTEVEDQILKLLVMTDVEYIVNIHRRKEPSWDEAKEV